MKVDSVPDDVRRRPTATVLYVWVIAAVATRYFPSDNRDVLGPLHPHTVVDDVPERDVVGRAREVRLVHSHVSDLEVRTIGVELTSHVD